MKVVYRSCVLILAVTYLAAMFPAERDVHVCTCRSHGSDCPCSMASVSHTVQADQCSLQCACGMEKPPPKGRAKLSGLCRCKEAKKYYEPPSSLAVMQSDVTVRLNEGSKSFRLKEGLALPGYKTPPMKPPPIV